MNTKIILSKKLLIVLALTFGLIYPSAPTQAANSCSCLVYYQNLTGLPATGDPNFAAKDYPAWLAQKGYGVTYYYTPQAGVSMVMSPSRSGSIYGHIAYIESASYNSTTGEWTIILWDANFNWTGPGITILKSTTHADCSNVKRVRWVTKSLNGLGFFKWSSCKPNKTVFGKDSYLLAEYFNNRTFSQPLSMERCEAPTIDRPWGSISPTWKNLSTSDNYKVIGVGTNNFSIRWSGPFYVTSGSYNLHGGVDDTLKIYINGTKVYSTDTPVEYEKTVSINNGQPLKLEYTEIGYSASFSFLWNRR